MENMTEESDIVTGPSFCGNCGIPVEPGARECTSCGHPVAVAGVATGGQPGTGGTVPADYLPYCRSCGVVVNWGDGHTCSRCGITPLCALHFRAADRLCFDCAEVPARFQTSVAPAGLRCGACGAAVAQGTDFCPNCGRGLAAPYAEQEYVGFWRRAGAFIVDWIILYATSVLVAVLVGIPLISGNPDLTSDDDIAVIIENFNYEFLFVFCGLYTVYGIAMTAWRGQTLGKMLLRIQVVDASGVVPPWPRVIMRELLRGLISIALFPLGLLYLWVTLDSRRRGLHDYLGGCYVVRKERGPRPPGGIV